MTRSNATRALALVAALTLSSALARGHRGDSDSTTNASNAQKANTKNSVEHTITWWCVDLNDLWNAKETVVIGGADLVGDPSFTPYCGDPDRFPITVPAGGTFMPGGTFFWATNKTYPAGYGAAVAAQGFTFAPHSNSPAEDFLQKLSQIRVDVFDFPSFDPVTTFGFDPQKNFKLVQLRDLFGALPFPQIGDPALGIDLSTDEVGRLPLYGFPVKAGPLPAGQYLYCVIWTFSADHWDGLGADPGVNLLPAGDVVYGCNRFQVAP